MLDDLGTSLLAQQLVDPSLRHWKSDLSTSFVGT
jgi:hypothetical protein